MENDQLIRKKRLKKYLIKSWKIVHKINRNIKNFRNQLDKLGITCLSFWVIINIIIGAFLAIALLVLRTFDKNNITIYQSSFSTISNNIGKKPWSDLYISFTNTCSSGYISTHIGAWPGTTAGCGTPGTLARGSCSSAFKSIDAFDYAPFNAKDLYQWKNMYFCVKQIDDYYHTTSNCKQGYAMCSPTICYNISQGCPITNISITNIDYISDSNTTQKVFTNTDPMTSTYIYLSRYYNQSPIIDFYYSASSEQCLDKGYGYNDPSDYYVLINNPPYGCRESGLDPYYKAIDYIWEYNLYIQNNMTWELAYLSNYASFTSNRIVFLAQQTKFILINNSICHENIDLYAFNQTIPIICNMDYYIAVTAIVQGSIQLFKLVITIILLFKYAKNRDYKLILYIVLMVLLTSISDSTLFGLTLQQKHQIDQLINSINDISNLECFTSAELNKILQEFMTSYNFLLSQFSIITTIFSSSLMVIFMSICCYIIALCY